MNAAADQHERYRGFNVELMHLAGQGWVFRALDPLYRREWSDRGVMDTLGLAAARAYAFVDDQYRREVDEVFGMAFGLKKG